MAEPSSIRAAPRLHIDIWIGFRPYFVEITIDFLITVSLWLVLFSFKLLTKWLSIGGWVGDFIINVHAAGAVGAYVIFALLFLVDVYTLHRQKAHEQS